MQTKVVQFATIVAILMFVIFFIPTKLYLDLIQNSENKKLEPQLESWANEIIFKIRVFENRVDDIFLFPRSAFFDSALEDSDGNIIFSTMENYPKLDSGVTIKNGAIYKKIALDKNIFSAKSLIVKAPYNLDEWYLRLSLLIFTTIPIFFIGSFVLLKLFIKPIEERRRIEELFFKDAMHEIKTPLGVIMLNLEILNEKLQNNIHIKRANYAVKNLAIIYEDIEHYIRHKYIKYIKERINFSQFLNDRVLYFSEAISISKITINREIEDNIFIDFSRIELIRIIDNTISNAIKYNVENGTLDLMLKRENNGVVLVIKDSGRGIKDIDKIFTRHYRGDEIKGGFGIGLSIVKAICDKNGVEIEVKSELGKGSSFIYTFRSDYIS